jgi:hypothetical protein
MLTNMNLAGPAAQIWLDQVAIDGVVSELRPDYSAFVIVAEDLQPGPPDQATDALLSGSRPGYRGSTGSPISTTRYRCATCCRSAAKISVSIAVRPGWCARTGTSRSTLSARGQLATLHPGALLSWRLVGAAR